MAAPVRGTQSLVGQMGWVFARPRLTLIEVAWRWLAGIPLLAVFWIEAQKILAAYPLETAGVTALNLQNPWVTAVQLASAFGFYQPRVAAVLCWLLPVTVVVWSVCSGVGRGLLLKQMEPRLRFRPLALMGLQAVWFVLLVATIWAWYRSIGWAAATHFSASGEPDLIGYFIWAIFLSLGYFTAWALLSWVLSVAPLLMLLESRSAVSSLGRAFSLGREFSSKLAEVNLVMGIVKLALIVLAMVFSAAPLPFIDELGGGALHYVWAGSMIFYLVANDYFQVVRVKAFIEFWKMFRPPAVGQPALARPEVR
jgi:hypothetical protein